MRTDLGASATVSAPVGRGCALKNLMSVYITRAIPEAGISALAAAGLSVSMNPFQRPLLPEELRDIVGRHDGVICQLTDLIDEKALEAAIPRCRVFAICAVGHDNIDVKAARRLGVTVTNTPDVLTEATADLTWALLLATARRLGEAERTVRAGAWRGWGMLDFLGMEVYGRTLGIIGPGRIGTAVARRASGFSMRVLYTDRAPDPKVEMQSCEEIEALGAQRVGLVELLKTSDFVSLHTPLTDETRHLIDATALERMKREAILVNTSRGAVIDQTALIEALKHGMIGGAGLDVYENEPIVSPELRALGNVVLLPHIGSATVATRSRMAVIAAQNVVSVLRGEEPLNPVAA